MRVKLVPPPPGDLETVRRARRAVPLVPRDEVACTTTIAGRLDLDRPDVARTWLTFLRGLGLVRRNPDGFSRTRVELDRASIADGLRSGVFPAEELLAAVGDEPCPPVVAFERVADRVPRWERDRDRNWTETWRGRIDDVLGWLVLAGCLHRTDEGYVRA